MSRNAGPSAARNAGIRAATEAFVAFIDADDVWAPQKLEIVDAFFAATDAALVCHAYTEAATFEATTTSHAAVPLPIYRLLIRNPASTSCAVMRKDTGLEFDEQMRHCEDYELWMRTAERHLVVRLVGPAPDPAGPAATFRGRLEQQHRGHARRRAAGLSQALQPRLAGTRLDASGLVVLSALKHGYSWLRRGRRSRRDMAA